MSALTVEFEFYGAAAKMLESREDEVVLSGPAGTGKSRACMVKVHLLALKYPRMKALVLRKTKESLNGSFTDEWEDVIKEPLASGMVRFFGGSARKPAQYQYANGSTVTLGGLDQAIKIMSTQYDVSFIQEATQLTEADWDSVTTRLRNGKMPYQQLIADCNPDAETHWLKQRAERGTAQMLFSLHKDNPRFFNRDGTPTADGVVYMRRLENLTGVRRDRLLKGLWVSAEGMIFDGFDPGVHMVDLPTFAEGTRLCAQGLPWEWTRYWGIDFGHTHPFVLQRWAEDPDGRLWMYREQYMSKRIVEEHVADLKAEVFDEQGKWTEPPPRAILADHNAEDRATFHKHFGRGTAAANKKVNQGLDACQSRFKIQRDGKPRIFFLRTALVKRDPMLAEARLPTCTVEEFPSYVWNETKDAPVKEKDDGCLIAGTLVATEDGLTPIEEVAPGSRVWTRSGLRQVLGSGMTNASAAVYRVELSSGEVLAGTGNHPVWVAGYGWKRLDALRYSDTLLSCRESNASASTGFSSAAIPTRRSGPSAATTSPASPIDSAASDTSTRRSGRPHTERSPRVARSTTATSTRSTTSWTTWLASRSPSTRKRTANATVSVGAAQSSWSALSGFVRWLRRGIGLKRGGLGIASSPPSTTLGTAPLGPVSASSAVRPTSASLCTTSSGSARTTASPSGGAHPVSTMWTGHAPTAVPCSGVIDTPGNAAATVRVLSISELDTRVPVFNLRVADHPEYFANGVLVHNCDTMRYVVAHRDMGVRPNIRVMGSSPRRRSEVMT